MSSLPLVRMWIAVSVLASAAGWILSALGHLDGMGYGLAAMVGLSGFWCARRWFWDGARWRPVGFTLRRFSRFLPLAFLGLAGLVFMGGALYAPANYDGLTYRLPRVLHWLAEGHWHWIHTANYRMNDRSCGFEWLMTPIILVTHSDRALFLVNFLPYLLLPGLVFSVFTRLGIKARVAWHWMWLLPTGYNFLLQAGSIGNDAFAAVYALAAVDFALRARVSGRGADLCFSLLAAALLTGAKSGNLPLLLPWALVFLPASGRWFISRGGTSSRRYLFAVPVAVSVALLVSFLPTAILNSRHCGDWTGISLESSKLVMQHPLIGVLGNSAMLLVSNFCPTLFPLAGWWNHAVPDRLPGGLAGAVQSNFEAHFCRLGEIPTEEWSGIGFGLSCLLAATVLAGWRSRGESALRKPSVGSALLMAPFVSLLVFFAKSGMMTLARLVSAYYPLLLPAVLHAGGASPLVRTRFWRQATIVVVVLAGIAVVLTPARPLWPAQTILGKLPHNASPAVQRLQDVYAVYAARPDSLVEARVALPPACKVVGFVAAPDDPGISLWRPYGERRVEEILPGDSSAQIRNHGVEYAVVSDVFLRDQRQSIDSWMSKMGATLVKTFSVTTEVSVGPSPWHVIRFNAP